METRFTQPPTGRLRAILHPSLSSVGVETSYGSQRDLELVVQKIEENRQHDRTSVFDRHGDPAQHPLSNEALSQLKQLCRKVLGYASPGRSTEHYASAKIIHLSMSDALVRRIFVEALSGEYGSLDSSLRRARAVCSKSQVSLCDEGIETHTLWSGLLRSCGDVDISEASKYLDMHHSALAGSLRHQKFSFVAARYLFHVLNIPLHGNSLFYLVKIWHEYMDVAIDAPKTIEWTNMNKCFEILPSDELRMAFVSPARLARFAAPLIQFWDEMPNLIQIFFSVPVIKYFVTLDSSSPFSPLRYRGMSVDKSHFRSLIFYQKYFLEKIEMNGLQTRTVFKNTIFDDGKRPWREYCNLASTHSVLSTGRGGRVYWVELRGTKLKADLDDGLKAGYDGALATFLVSSISCNLPKVERPLFDIPLNVLRDVGSIIGKPSIPIFDNVPYLRRFRVNGKIYITSDGLPEPASLFIEHARSNPLHNRGLFVDTMHLNDRSISWMRVDGAEDTTNFLKEIPPPIFAGLNENGKSLYVAAVKIGHFYHFTCAANGAATVKYTDEDGIERESDTFFVLFHLQNVMTLACESKLEWQAFWPKKAYDYRPASESARKDDEHLEECLNTFREDMGHFLRE